VNYEIVLGIVLSREW